jgi:ABC-type Fe3+/spermidine/putrescine transport system ATPase subunit
VVGITFVYVTHDQEEAITMSDMIVVMRDGRIQQQGPPEDLYERPRNRFVAGFLGLSNFFAGLLAEHDPATGWASVDVAGGLRLRGRLTDLAARPGIGTEVTVAARPERFAVGSRGVGDRSDAAETTVPGRLTQATYLGDQNEYRVETDLGEIVARRQNTMGGEAATSIGPGDPVEVRWRDEANLVLAS